MAEMGIVMVFKGKRKNLSGRYHDGSCILTPKGLFLYSSEIGWTKIYDSIAAFFDLKAVDLEMTDEEIGQEFINTLEQSKEPLERLAKADIRRFTSYAVDKTIEHLKNK